MKNSLKFLGDEDGSAVLEFLGFGLLLQVAVLVGLASLTNLQSQQLAAESISRHALRTYVLFGTDPEVTANQLVGDFGLEVRPVLKLTCNPDCQTIGSVLRLRVSIGDSRAEAVTAK